MADNDPRSYRENLLTLAAEYGRVRGLSIARISTLFSGGGVFFKRLDEGKTCTVDSYIACLEWFSANWPEGAEWPANLDRPANTQAADHRSASAA